VASEVDICNLALSYLGDTALVTSINPPTGSAQAAHCARFYPAARDQVLEMHPWNFCTGRALLAQLSSNPTVNSTLNPNGVWSYAYAAPNNALNYLAVYDPQSASDYWATFTDPTNSITFGAPGQGGVPISKDFVVETDPNTGSEIILTNQVNAALRYSFIVTDTTKFSPLATDCIARLLAAKLAGPLIKGEEGRAAVKDQMAAFAVSLAMAQASDANSRRVTPPKSTASWITGRN